MGSPCASAADGARVRLTARTTVSPIRRIAHLGGGWLAGVYPNGATRTNAAPHEHALFDHLVRLQQQCLRDRQAQGLGGLHVDDELELGRSFDRQTGWLGALEDFV